MDFFWGYIRDIVHSEKVEYVLDTAAVAEVPVDVLSRVWGEVEFRFDICRAFSGANIELH
jgi:hypothetical protein